MREEQGSQFEKISDEDMANISGGNVSMIYKKGFRWYVWDPRGRLIDKFLLRTNALDCATKLSKESPGNESGALKILTYDEYKNKTSAGTIQKII